MNILTIFAEISLLFLVFLLLDWLVVKICQQLLKVRFLQHQQDGIKQWQRNLRVALRLCSLLLCLVIIGSNGFLLYQDENLPEYTLALIHRIPSSLWLVFALGSAKTLGLIILGLIIRKKLSHCHRRNTSNLWL